MIELNKIYCEKNQETMARMPDCFVDSIVTDPPYELGFMGKKWDSSGIAYNVIMWKECLRVLKPGGYLLAFGGTRTSHRMVCAIEDAGFEIRDSILWLYGSGFPKSLDIGKAVNKLESEEWTKISKAIDNINNNSIFEAWKRNSSNVNFVEKQSQKNQIEIGTSIIKRDIVPDNVSGNPVIISQPLNVKIAELILQEALPCLEENIITVQENADTSTKQLQDPVKFVEELPQNHNQSYCNIFTVQENVRQLLKENIDLKTKAEEVLTILRGKMMYSNEQITNAICAILTENLKRTILNQSKTFQNLDTSQQTECASVISVTITEYMAECLITNMVNIAKQIIVDKLQGNEREVVGKYKHPDGGNRSLSKANDSGNCYQRDGREWEKPLTKGTSEFEGWGTALKPAHEPICVARKPIEEKTVAANVLKYGTGGINIDGCRVEFENTPNAATNPKYRTEHGYKLPPKDKMSNGVTNFVSGGGESNLLGRFPANIILDPFTADELDKQVPEAGAFAKVKSGHNGKSQGIYGDYASRGDDGDTFYDDKGGASRFFYIAKADRSERNEGLHQFKAKVMNWSSGTQNHGSFQSEGTNRSSQNFHPTVKPIKLIQCLQRLVTPKGGLTYDPFGGSGTSAISAQNEGFKWILSELVKEYCDISEKRIYNNGGLFL